ncbi:MAG: Gfo/Idh/MocA family oxidoreductase [Treponema sp.]|jgi:predicted dehydrogenase|nr:Gfo/Idh/MocA family oxidoreductase [Treponema sp.]
MTKIRWGMIGCGDVTEVKNGPGLYKCRDSELVGVTNRTTAKAEDWVRRHGHGSVFPSVKELLACPDIDIVYIATTPETHKEMALLCAAAGKHCYLEKPIAHSYKDAVELQKVFASAGKKIFVAHYRRGLPKTKKLKELIQRISPVQSVRVVRTDTQKTLSGWRADTEISGGGPFFETDVHLVDLLDYLFGPLYYFHTTGIFTAKANKANKGREENTITLIAQGRDGIIISGLWQYGAFKALDICEVYGANGHLTFAGMSTGGKAVLETADRTEEIVFPDEEHVGLPLEQMIVDELLGRSTCPSTLETAMRALKICENAYGRSAFSGLAINANRG